jgi:hypothetical protein
MASSLRPLRRFLGACLLAAAALATGGADCGQPDEPPRDDVVRSRESIYLLRFHLPGIRDDEWAGALRELIEIGKPAVPELVFELDRTSRDHSLAALGLALRGIGDARAVPALIRALPRTLVEPRSTYGITLLNAELLAFMQAHDHGPNDAGTIR